MNEVQSTPSEPETSNSNKPKRRVLIPNTSAGLHFLTILDAAISELDAAGV